MRRPAPCGRRRAGTGVALEAAFGGEGFEAGGQRPQLVDGLDCYQAARDLDNGGDYQRSSSAAKLVAAALATKVAAMAVQVCGAHRTRETASFGRYFRDAKAYDVAGGSSEILKNTLAKSLVKTDGLDPRFSTGAPPTT